MGYRLNRLDEPVFIAVSKPLLTEFGIHHRLESCEGKWYLTLTPRAIRIIAFQCYKLSTSRHNFQILVCQTLLLKKLTANYSLIAHSCTCGESPKFNWFSEKKEMFPYDVFEEGFLSPNRIISANKIGSHPTLNHCCR